MKISKEKLIEILNKDDYKYDIDDSDSDIIILTFGSVHVGISGCGDNDYLSIFAELIGEAEEWDVDFYKYILNMNFNLGSRSLGISENNLGKQSVYLVSYLPSKERFREDEFLKEIKEIGEFSDKLVDKLKEEYGGLKPDEIKEEFIKRLMD